MINKENLNGIALELDLSVDVVEKTYKAYWYFIRSTIEALPLKEDITEEEFLKLRTNFNLPSLGKLSCTLGKFNKIKNRYNYIKNIRNGIKDNKD